MTVLEGSRARIRAGLVEPAKGSMFRWILICSALCVGLRLPFINVPLNIDEGGDSFVARSWGTTQGSMYGGSWLDRPPLLVLLYKAGVLGGDLGVRLLGMAAAILLVVGTMLIANNISGLRAARMTGIITAIMSSSVVLGAVFTSNEILATVPVTYSILALFHARESDRARLWLFSAGLLASCAFLIKQSFADVLVAGAIFLFVSWATRERSRFEFGWIAWWIAGVMAPLLATLAWFHFYSVGIRQFIYAVVGFRIDSLADQAANAPSASYMFLHLGLPILIASGCLIPVPWAFSWLYRRRTDPQVSLTLAAWLVVGILGIGGGGNYFPHYFIQPLAALSVMSGCAIAASHRRYLGAATGVLFAILAVANIIVGLSLVKVDPPQQRTLAVAKYLRTNSHPDDSLYVMYARANLLYYADMKSPYPYAWNMMVRAVPRAQTDLRTLLDSPIDRPTWVVVWQGATSFGLDKSGKTRQLLLDNYVQTDQICGKAILIRKDQAYRQFRAVRPKECAVLDTPRNLGPSETRDPSDSAEYLWQ